MCLQPNSFCQRCQRAKIKLLLMILFLITLAFHENFKSSNEKNHSKKNLVTCEQIIRLNTFSKLSSDVESRQIFYIETSYKKSLRGRQCCVIESAVLNSELKPKVLMTANYINLTENSNFCQLVMSYYPHSLEFYTMDTLEILKGTPLEGIERRLTIRNTEHHAVHLSDALRQALVYKYGGFYLDFDVMTLRSLKTLRNFYGIDQFYAGKKPDNCALPEGSQLVNKWLNNGHFHFDAKSRFVWQLMQHLNNTYEMFKGARMAFGPPRVYSVAKQFLNVTHLHNVNSKDLSILPSYAFEAAYDKTSLYFWSGRDRDDSYWEELLRCSYGIHIINSWTKKLVVTGNPKRELYAYLGPKNCPISFSDLNNF
ncbi:lactosylceramide 4-alpha-galactosyltransferase-like isoform X2 [Convolutriloba macropyga]|uniref:lactosylceramide 4-alpha-galactosyltransferase-like isoform X2 n=1 Tax=Convolutriloba macropyga TaxID=536237 RepID=UPI003F5254C9